MGVINVDILDLDSMLHIFGISDRCKRKIILRVSQLKSVNFCVGVGKPDHPVTEKNNYSITRRYFVHEFLSYCSFSAFHFSFHPIFSKSDTECPLPTKNVKQFEFVTGIFYV